MSSKGKGKRTAAMVGGGAAGGAAIGAVAGGGKGAAIGALIGAAAGTGGAGLTRNRDINLGAGTPLDFKPLQAVKMRQKKGVGFPYRLSTVISRVIPVYV